MKVLSVFGTRPEAIKMCPLIKQLQATDGIESRVCLTGQHREMLDSVTSLFGVTADSDLDIMRPDQTLESITAAVLTGIMPVLGEERPDLVLVQGDTTTAFSAALAAFYRRIPVGHVEAGLRTRDRYSPFPEEINRVLLSRLAVLHFAPTANNANNLMEEGITGNVFVTGNTVIDAFATTVTDHYEFHDQTLRSLARQGKKLITLTAHRRENHGRPLENILSAVQILHGKDPEHAIVYPVHPNPAVREPAFRMLGGMPGIHLLEPLDVADMHNLLARSTLVLTDSGGLQEEAPAFGVPVLVLRTETERPEAVEAGTARVAGIETDAIVELAHELLTDENAYRAMAHAVNPYGDGHASERIAGHILDWYASVRGRNRAD